MSVLIFLLDTLFFFLVAAALLRAWLNGARISMAQQPGPFLMALTDWLVKPLRRGLPAAMQRSRWDVASLIAAALLALAYAGLWLGVVNTVGGTAHLSGGVGPALFLALPVLALKFLLRTVLQGLLAVLLVYALLSWVQPHAPIYSWLGRLIAPLLGPLRRVIPLVGGVDLSPLALILMLQIGLMLVG